MKNKNRVFIMILFVFIIGVVYILFLQASQLIELFISIVGSETREEIVQIVFEGYNQNQLQAGKDYFNSLGYGNLGIRYLYQQVLLPYTLLLLFLSSMFVIGFIVISHYEKTKKYNQYNQIVELALNQIDTIDQDEEYIQLIDVLKKRNQLEENQKKEYETMNRKQLIYLENVAHQIKTYLASLILLQEINLETEESVQKKENIIESLDICSNINQLVTQLMKAGKLRSNQNNLEFEKTDIKELITDCISQLSIQYPSIHFSLNSRDSMYIYADYLWLKEAFINILDNCGRNSPLNSEIVTYIKKIDQTIVVTIEDEGCGISDDEIDFIFNRFHQLKNSYDEVHFGIGLHLAKDIIEAHWGSIEVSRRIDKGSCFKITFSKLLTE